MQFSIILIKIKKAQNSQMMYTCIMDSLTTEAQTKILIDAEMFTVMGYLYGLCLLKILLGMAQTDTIATVNVLRIDVSKLPSKMVEFNGNTVALNNYVMSIETAMASYGETSREMLMNVIMAYEEVEDEVFVGYVRNKRLLWEEGHTVLDLYTLLSHC
jgi:hypothetical protein